MSHYRENGNRDPRGLGGLAARDEWGQHDDYDRSCPFCGRAVPKNKLFDHLPCDGVKEGSA